MRGQIGQLVRAPKTSELIAAQLRRQIVRGVVKPGEKLPAETQLMAQFGVSRPTMREAFRILETERLIAVRPGSRGGALVVAPDPTAAARYVGLLLQLQGATIDDVYEARKVAEPACAGMLARCRTEQDLADLAGVVAEIESAIGAGGRLVPDPVLWSRLTHRFHELIMQRSGNKTLALQGAVLHDIVAIHTQLRVSRSFGDGVLGALPARGAGLQETASADRGGRRRRRRAPVARPHGLGRGLPAQGRPAGQAGGGAVRLTGPGSTPGDQPGPYAQSARSRTDCSWLYPAGIGASG